MEALPDELLHQILLYVPWYDLLGLRLVCRRWSRVVLQRPVWQSRYLVGYTDLYLANIIRLVPAVKGVGFVAKAGSKSWLPLATVLSRGTCKVQELFLRIYLESDDGSPMSKRGLKAIRRMLDGQRHCMQLFQLRVYYGLHDSPIQSAGRSVKETFHQIMSSVDSLAVAKLNLVTACGTCNDEGHRCNVSYAFEGLRSLRELFVVKDSCGPSFRSLLSTSKNTLQVVHTFEDIAPVVDDLLACRLLKELGIPTMADWGFLRQCSAVDVLTVYADVCEPGLEAALDSVRRLMDQAHLPREVRIDISYLNIKTLSDHCGYLSRVRHLVFPQTYRPIDLYDHASWLTLLRGLPLLTVLQVPAVTVVVKPPPEGRGEPALLACLCAGTTDAVPSLARLVVKCTHWTLAALRVDTVPKLKLSRPHLSVELDMMYS